MTHVILVVEDNERNLKLLRDVLEYAGFDVRAARTAEDGISLAVSEPPDLVLMDLQLPGIDGLEALRRSREPADRGHTVVAVTAQAMKHDRERALEAALTGTWRSRSVSAPFRSGSQVPPRRGGGDRVTPDPLVLVVDDLPQNVRLLEAVLSPKGFRVATASSGEEALDVLSKEHPDLVLLDILMPGMDGYEVCRRIREDPETAFLPVIMITASGGQEKIRAIESGADDFVNKPFDQAELLARVRSLVRVKRYHDTIENQAAELSAWNRELEQRVRDQIEQLERVGRLRRFLPQQLADLIISSGDESFLNAHRRQITVVCCDLRGFTAFAETAEPEDVWEIPGVQRCPGGSHRPV